MRSAGGAFGIAGSGMSSTIGGGPRLRRRGRGGCSTAPGLLRSPGAPPHRSPSAGDGCDRGRMRGAIGTAARHAPSPALLAAQRALIASRSRPRLGRGQLLALSCDLLDLGGIAAAAAFARPSWRRGAAGGDQIGRHRGTHFRAGGVVLAQETRDLPALGQPLRALVTGRTGRGEDLRRIPRVGKLRLRAQAAAMPATVANDRTQQHRSRPKPRHLRISAMHAAAAPVPYLADSVRLRGQNRRGRSVPCRAAEAAHRTAFAVRREFCSNGVVDCFTLLLRWRAGVSVGPGRGPCLQASLPRPSGACDGVCGAVDGSRAAVVLRSFIRHGTLRLTTARGTVLRVR